MDDKMKSYFDKLLLEKEMNEMGTDFASPDDRQSAMYSALQGEMQGMMPNSQEIPMEPINNIVEADNAPNDQDRLKEMVKEYVKMRQEPQRFQDGGNVNEEMPLGELRLQQGMYEEEMDEKERGSFEDRQKRAIRKLEDEIYNKKYEETSGDKVLNWLTAIGAAAKPLNQPYLPDTGDVQYWGDSRKKQFEADRKNKIGQLTNLQNMYNSLKKKDKDPMKQRKLDLEERKLGLEESKLESKLKELESDKNKPKRPAEFEKAFQKKQAEKYQEVQDKGIAAQENDFEVDDVLNSFLNYSKNSIAGTGPVATLAGSTKYLDDELQSLDSKFKNLGLKKMTQMFAGMSKAVDSDAERRAYEATVPSIANDDKVNVKILLGTKAINLRNKLEAKNQREYLEQNGSMDGYESTLDKNPISIVVEKSTGRLRPIPRKELSKLKNNPEYVTLDQYADLLLEE